MLPESIKKIKKILCFEYKALPGELCFKSQITKLQLPCKVKGELKKGMNEREQHTCINESKKNIKCMAYLCHLLDFS